MSGSWIVYSRAGCGLCEEFALELAELIGEERSTQVNLVDIDTDLELARKYSDRIPVLTIDGDFVCSHRLNVERVRRYLKQGE